MPTEIINSRQNPVITEPLGRPTVSRKITVGATSASQALTATCRRVSITAVGGAVRYAIGGAGIAATADNSGGASHYIADGARLDIAVAEGTTIAAIRATGSVATSLEITELAG